jgi:hypothetical protein
MLRTPRFFNDHGTEQRFMPSCYRRTFRPFNFIITAAPIKTTSFRPWLAKWKKYGPPSNEVAMKGNGFFSFDGG